MSFIFSAIVPNHPKLALETMPNATEEQSKTYQALKELEGELYFMKPDTIILVTSHGSQVPELINTNISSKLQGTWPEDLPELNDINIEIHGDVEFAAHLKEVIDLEKKELPMTITAESRIVPEITASLIFLLDHLKNTRVVVISTGDLTREQHYEFGEFIRHQALQTNKRVAVIASGHLSEYNGEDDSEKNSLDNLYQQFFKEKHPEKILNINEQICGKSGSDLIMPVAVLLGAVHNLNYDIDTLCYEKLHGQGQAVVNFILK